MSRKVSVLAFLLALASLLVSPAYAQFDPFGSNYYADPGNGGGSAYAPFYYPYEDRYPGYSYGYAPPQSAYVDPYDGGRDYGRSPGDYDLGQQSRQMTRVEVANPTRQPPGTIVIDTATRELYLTEPNGRALRYGIGVGRQGFAWKGTARVARKAEWPGWTPPSDMLKRRPDLPLHMEGGIENPLGARALYLYQGKRDTMFRIHGTNEPDTIGKAVSSGCIRMMNADVEDLYSRVPIGTRVVVL